MFRISFIKTFSKSIHLHIQKEKGLVNDAHCISSILYVYYFQDYSFLLCICRNMSFRSSERLWFCFETVIEGGLRVKLDRVAYERKFLSVCIVISLSTCSCSFVCVYVNDDNMNEKGNEESAVKLIYYIYYVSNSRNSFKNKKLRCSCSSMECFFWYCS